MVRSNSTGSLLHYSSISISMGGSLPLPAFWKSRARRCLSFFATVQHFKGRQSTSTGPPRSSASKVVRAPAPVSGGHFRPRPASSRPFRLLVLLGLARTRSFQLSVPLVTRLGLVHFGSGYLWDSRVRSRFSPRYPCEWRALINFSVQYPWNSRGLESFRLRVHLGLARTQVILAFSV